MTDRPKFLDRDDPFFAKAWVRVGTVALPAGIAVLDFTIGNPGWGVLFLAGSGWALWELFLRK